MSPRTTAWGTYRGIYAALRERITDGEFSPGMALPSESALCAEYGVARNTARRALDRLADDGLIDVRPGRGRVVAEPGAGGGTVAPRYLEIAEALRKRIASGELRPGDAVPSESALAELYEVGRGTVRHALAELEGAGLVQAVHGKGRFVRSPD